MTVDFRYYLNRQGVPGRQGEQGEPGFSPIITIEEDTLSSFVLAIQTEGNYILTPNLREHKEDLGGTYIRYNRETGAMYAGDADYADTGKYGVVKFASADDIARDDDSTAVTPNNVNSIISDKGLISAEDLQTYLQPGNHITFTINDGVITINGEAGGNYTEGAGIDITNKVISVDFSAVATAAQGAKADSAVQPAALNNYYTKSVVYNKGETDTLLDEKQDKLTPNNPLSISTYTKSNLNGLSYTQDGTGVYSTIGAYNYVTRNSISVSNYTGSEGSPWVAGYIDIPYNPLSKKIISAGRATTNLYSDSNRIIFGKFIDEEFIPILVSTRDGYKYWYLNMSDNISYNGNTLIFPEDLVMFSRTGGDCYSLPSTGEAGVLYGYIAYINSTEGSYSVPCSLTGYSSSSHNFYYQYHKTATTTSNIDYINRVNEITTARIIPTGDVGSNASKPLNIQYLGLYDSQSIPSITTLQTAGALGTNEFDISGLQSYNYLDLHIGSGLAVQNGNLVNTNPTAPDLSNYYTKGETDTLLNEKPDFADIPVVGNGTITFTQGGASKGTITTNQSSNTTIALDSYTLPIASTSTLGGVKVDGTSITIDNNGVISSSGGGGGGGSYTAGTGIDITNSVISVEASLLQQIATMQDLINQYSYRIAALENSINGGNSDLSGSVLPSASLASLSLLSGGLSLNNSKNLDVVNDSILEPQDIEGDDNDTNLEDE